MKKEKNEDLTGRVERKKKLLSVIEDEKYKPLKLKEFMYLFQVSVEDKAELVELLNELEHEGKVIVTAKGKYQSLGNGLKMGIFEGHVKGFGFISVEDETEDYFVPENAAGGALHKDKVLFKTVESTTGKRAEAAVVKILERGFTTLVGTYQKSKAFGFVIPDNIKYNKDIFIAKKDINLQYK